MPTWTIHAPVARPAGWSYPLSGPADGPAEVWFEAEGLDLPAPDGSAGLLLALLPAMRRGADLRIEAPVDPLLLRQLPGIQAMLADWMKGLRPVKVAAEAGPLRLPRAEHTGVFFSGGSDSWFSLLKYAGIATHAVHVWGFDIRDDDAVLAAAAQAPLRPAVEARGVRWVRVRTNLRRFTDPHTAWGEEQHGAALAAVAALLAPVCGRMVLAGSYTYQVPAPFASHPMLDPLWSTSGCTVVHDGVEASRTDKLQRVMADPDALATLRVCFDNTDGAYNCGRCFKCALTMLSMLMRDPGTTYPSFAHKLDVETLATCRIGASFWLRSLSSRLAALRPLVAGRPDLRPYERVLARRLRRGRALIAMHRSFLLRPVGKALAPSLHFSRGFAKR